MAFAMVRDKIFNDVAKLWAQKCGKLKQLAWRRKVATTCPYSVLSKIYRSDGKPHSDNHASARMWAVTLFIGASCPPRRSVDKRIFVAFIGRRLAGRKPGENTALISFNW